MKNLFIILFLLLVCLVPQSIWGQTIYPASDYEYVGPEMIPALPTPSSSSDTSFITQDSIPLTISTDNHTYVLMEDVTATGTAITIMSGSDTIWFDGQGYDVTFGTGNGNTTSGLATQLWATIRDVWFRQTNWIHGTTDSSADSTYGIRLITNNSYRWRFDTCTVLVYGKRDSSTILEDSSYVAGECQAISDQGNAGANQQSFMWFGGSLTVVAWGYENRMHEDGYAVVLKEGLDVPEADSTYHYIFHDVNVTGLGGLSLEGRVWISACSISVDARNERYWPPWGPAYWASHQGCANQAAIGSGGLQKPSRITNNYITAGYDLQGMDEAFHFERNCLDLPDENVDSVVQVDSNYARAHFRVDPSYGADLNTKIITSRSGNKDTWIHHNTFITEVGDTNSDSAWGPNSWILKWNSSTDLGYGSDTNWVFENNYCEVVPKTPTITMGEQSFKALSFVTGDNADSAEYLPAGAGVIVRYNYLKTPQWAYSIGTSDGSSQFCDFIYGDTVDFFESDPSIYFITVVEEPAGYGVGNLGYYNYIQDVVYVGELPDTLIRLQAGASTLSVGLKQTLFLLIHDAGGSPVISANVWVVNAYGDTVINTTSDGSGMVLGVVKYRDEFTDFPDSTAFNDFTFGAQKAGDTTTQTYTVDWDTFTDTLVLSQTGSATSTCFGAGTIIRQGVIIR